jgi:hypothetical protein
MPSAWQLIAPITAFVGSHLHTLSSREGAESARKRKAQLRVEFLPFSYEPWNLFQGFFCSLEDYVLYLHQCKHLTRYHSISPTRPSAPPASRLWRFPTISPNPCPSTRSCVRVWMSQHCGQNLATARATDKTREFSERGMRLSSGHCLKWLLRCAAARCGFR